ncbi:MAG: 5-oxoproline transporter, DUF969 family subunit [Brevinema sp.]
MIKLVGILIILIGFILKLDTIAVVIIAAVATGLVSGMDFSEILSVLGESFVSTRYMSIFLITLPAIGLLESNGLRNTATRLIQKIKNATVGNIVSVFMFARTALSIFGVRLGGHVQFIRPVLFPMLDSVANAQRSLNQKQEDQLKALACAVENYGNFYGQNVFIANAGVLLVVGTLQELGFVVKNTDIAFYSIPVAFSAVVLVCFQSFFINKKFMGR